MTQLQIKEKIDTNNKILETLMTPKVFTLNNAVSELLKENAEIQAICERS